MVPGVGHSLEASFSAICDIIKNTVFSCLLDYFPPNSQVSHTSFNYLFSSVNGNEALEPKELGSLV
jgi:hypothetical protein